MTSNQGSSCTCLGLRHPFLFHGHQGAPHSLHKAWTSSIHSFGSRSGQTRYSFVNAAGCRRGGLRGFRGSKRHADQWSQMPAGGVGAGYRQSLEGRETWGPHPGHSSCVCLDSQQGSQEGTLACHAERVPQSVLQPVLFHLPLTPAPVRLGHRLSVLPLQNALSPTLNVPIYPTFKIHMLPPSHLL